MNVLRTITLEKIITFSAPEKVSRDNVGVAADIWGVGLLAFVL